MKVDIVTIFPRMVEAGVAEGVVGRARERGLVDIKVHNLRDFTTDRHHVVDDVPFGGGLGMVMKPEPFFAAVGAIRERRGSPQAVVLLSPAGQPFSQATARRLAGLSHIVVLCGRYEGIDERVREAIATDEISIGDYVLSGGEVPALAVVDVVTRLVPGVVGDELGCRSDGALRVETIQLGRSLNPDRSVASHTTQFKPSDTIYVAVLTPEAGSGTIGVRWTYAGRVVDEPSKDVSYNGPSATEFHLVNAGVPVGGLRRC